GAAAPRGYHLGLHLGSDHRHRSVWFSSDGTGVSCPFPAPAGECKLARQFGFGGARGLCALLCLRARTADFAAFRLRNRLHHESCERLNALLKADDSYAYFSLSKGHRLSVQAASENEWPCE